MIIINQDQLNTFVLYLKDSITIENPYYIFNWRDTYNREVIFSLPDESSTNFYNKFSFDSSDHVIMANGLLYVYESPYDASIIDGSMNLLTPTYGIPYQYRPNYFDDFNVIDVSLDLTDGVLPIIENDDFYFNPLTYTVDKGIISPYASKIYVDSTFVKKEGDTMTGPLVVNDLDHVTTIDFNPSTFINSIGRLGFDVEEGALSFGLPDGGSMQIGKEMFGYFTNLSGTTLVDGDVVSVVSVAGNRIAVTLTDAKNSLLANNCIGMVTSGAGPNQKVRVTNFGLVHDLNTDSFTEGQQVYVDPNNPGKLTSTMPTAPNMIVSVGIVLVKNQNVGIIGVRTQTSPRLRDLSDVNRTPLTQTGQLLVWHADTSVWDTDFNIKNYLKEASLGTAFVWYGGKLDVSIVSGYSTAYIDGSLNTLKQWNITQDTSLVNLRSWNVTQDASIEDLRSINIIQDSSIVDLKNINTVQDASLSDRVRGSIRITVSSTAPASPNVNDLWIDIS